MKREKEKGLEEGERGGSVIERKKRQKERKIGKRNRSMNEEEKKI